MQVIQWGVILHLKGNGIVKARLHSSFYVQYGKQFPELEVNKQMNVKDKCCYVTNGMVREEMYEPKCIIYLFKVSLSN